MPPQSDSSGSTVYFLGAGATKADFPQAPLLDGLACAISMAEALAKQRPMAARAGPTPVESVGLSKGLAKLIGSP